ncbi:lactadherin-like [Actinia tenebrosa]|uniref:Lactadherin-like n=1 Tax=Actinia tenebrosa TaxID=6105 RepID=A0A6P8H8M5_ACTTE|nr:lactadherin-like [Actinia tenebrosa]
MQDAYFTFDVIFNHNSMLKTGRHHVITPVELRYYKDYVEDSTDKVTSKGLLYTEPLVTHEMIVEVPGCSSALGMASKEISDYQITASSSYSDVQPSQAREGDDAWCAFTTNDQQYIQVDFLFKTRVTRIVTYGRRTKLFWVTQYSLQYSSDERTWQYYQENGFTKVYQANQDRFTPKSYWLHDPIEVYSLRIRPLAWEKLICMRFELYGCRIIGSPLTCIEPLGLESGDIPDEALTQSTNASIYASHPVDIRLNKKVTKYPNGWQAALGVLDYLQIDFGSLRRVTRIASQGGHDVPYYVSGFKLKYSNNSIDWFWYEVNGVEEEIKGPKDSYEAKRPIISKLAAPFVCRYLRIIPTAAASLKVMRAEVYGCSAEQIPPYKGLPEYSRRSFILDPSSNLLFVCMYTANRFESSCLSTRDGKEWNGIESFIISIVAYNPTLGHLYGLDRSMNYYRSNDQGDTWVVVSSELYNKMRQKYALTMASGIPDNVTSSSPPAFLSITSANGMKWGASGAGIHLMAAGSNTWTTVGSWRCCGN